MTSAVWTQVSHRGRNDDGSEVSATWKAIAGADANVTQDTNIRWRFQLRVATKDDAIDARLRYSLNGGAYTEVLGTSLVVRPSDSPNLTEDQATTQQMGGTPFTAGSIDEVNGITPSISVVAGNYTEVEYCFQIRSADTSIGNTVALRVYDGSTALTNYTDTPLLTIVAAAPGEVTATAGLGILVTLGYTPALQLTHASYPLAGLNIFYGYAPTVTMATAAVTAQPSVGIFNSVGYVPQPVVEILLAVSPIAGFDTLAGYAPATVVEQANQTAPVLGVLQIVGYAPSPALTAEARPADGLEIFSGYIPSVTLEGILIANPSAGALNVVGYAPSPALTAEVRPSAGLENLSGYAPAINIEEAAEEAAPSVGTLIVAGYPVFWEVINSLNPSGGLGVIAGYTASQEVINDIHPTDGIISAIGHEPIIEERLTGLLILSGDIPALEVINDEYPSCASLNITGETSIAALTADVMPIAGLISFAPYEQVLALEADLVPDVGTIHLVGAIQTIAEIAFPSDGLLDINGYESNALSYTEELTEPADGTIELAGYVPIPRLVAESVPTTGIISYTSAQQVVDHGYFSYPFACVLTVTRNTVIGSVNVDPWVPQADGAGIWTPVVSVKRRDIEFR